MACSARYQAAQPAGFARGLRPALRRGRLNHRRGLGVDGQMHRPRATGGSGSSLATTPTRRLVSSRRDGASRSIASCSPCGSRQRRVGWALARRSSMPSRNGASRGAPNASSCGCWPANEPAMRFYDRIGFTLLSDGPDVESGRAYGAFAMERPSSSGLTLSRRSGRGRSSADPSRGGSGPGDRHQEHRPMPARIRRHA